MGLLMMMIQEERRRPSSSPHCHSSLQGLSCKLPCKLRQRPLLPRAWFINNYDIHFNHDLIIFTWHLLFSSLCLKGRWDRGTGDFAKLSLSSICGSQLRGQCQFHPRSERKYELVILITILCWLNTPNSPFRWQKCYSDSHHHRSRRQGIHHIARQQLEGSGQEWRGVRNSHKTLDAAAQQYLVVLDKRWSRSLWRTMGKMPTSRWGIFFCGILSFGHRFLVGHIRFEYHCGTYDSRGGRRRCGIQDQELQRQGWLILLFRVQPSYLTRLCRRIVTSLRPS